MSARVEPIDEDAVRAMCEIDEPRQNSHENVDATTRHVSEKGVGVAISEDLLWAQ